MKGVGAATLGTDAANAAQIQNGLGYAADTGAADAYVIAPTPPITAYHVGQQFSFLVAHSNLSTSPTLAVSGLTAGTILNAAGGAVAAGALLINTIAVVVVSGVTTGTPTFELQGVTNGYVGAAGTINNLAWFAATGRTISSLATANSGLLVTSAGGVPSISSTIPNGVIATTQAQADNSTKLATDAYVDRVGVQQVQFTKPGSTASGTTAIPYDDTIPQSGEGDEYMTLAITPKSATSKLVIAVIIQGACGTTDVVTAALFQDSTANALAASPNYFPAGSTGDSWGLRLEMTSGTTSATTFKVRAGSSGGGTFYFNGTSGGRIYGGVAASSITITEIGV